MSAMNTTTKTDRPAELAGTAGRSSTSLLEETPMLDQATALRTELLEAATLDPVVQELIDEMEETTNPTAARVLDALAEAGERAPRVLEQMLWEGLLSDDKTAVRVVMTMNLPEVPAGLRHALAEHDLLRFLPGEPDPDSSEMARAWAEYNEAFNSAVKVTAELIRRNEAGEISDEAVIDGMAKATLSIPPRPEPPTEAEVAEAHQLVRETLELVDLAEQARDGAQ